MSIDIYHIGLMAFLVARDCGRATKQTLNLKTNTTNKDPVSLTVKI